MRHCTDPVLLWGTMQQPLGDGTQWELIRMQVSQSLVEHEIVAQALRAQAIVSTMFILALGSLCFFLWRRHGCLNEAFHAEIKQHSAAQSALLQQHSSERVSIVKQHSLELVSLQMQMLHAFEGMASPRPAGSASGGHSSEASSSGRRTPTRPGGA